MRKPAGSQERIDYISGALKVKVMTVAESPRACSACFNVFLARMLFAVQPRGWTPNSVYDAFRNRNWTSESGLILTNESSLDACDAGRSRFEQLKVEAC